MEGLKQYYIELETLRNQAIRLCANASSLADIFTEEANRLHRVEEASQLVALRSSILEQLDLERTWEAASRSGDSTARLAVSFIKLGMGVAIKAVSKDKQLAAFSDYLLKQPAAEQPTFGNVLIVIGPKGIPGDVGVISISRLARESKREESHVINEIKERGCLILGEEAFSLLMGNLANGIQEGRLLLPISLEKLS